MEHYFVEHYCYGLLVKDRQVRATSPKEAVTTFMKQVLSEGHIIMDISKLHVYRGRFPLPRKIVKVYRLK